MGDINTTQTVSTDRMAYYNSTEPLSKWECKFKSDITYQQHGLANKMACYNTKKNFSSIHVANNKKTELFCRLDDDWLQHDNTSQPIKWLVTTWQMTEFLCQSDGWLLHYKILNRSGLLVRTQKNLLDNQVASYKMREPLNQSEGYFQNDKTSEPIG